MASTPEIESLARGGDVDLAVETLLQAGRQGLRGPFLPMDEKDAPGGRIHAADPFQNLVAIPVSAESFQRVNLCAAGDRLSQDVDHVRAGEKPPAKPSLRLKSHQRDQVLLIRKPVPQVMENPPSLAHSGGGNDYERSGPV